MYIIPRPQYEKKSRLHYDIVYSGALSRAAYMYRWCMRNTLWLYSVPVNLCTNLYCYMQEGAGIRAA